MDLSQRHDPEDFAGIVTLQSGRASCLLPPYHRRGVFRQPDPKPVVGEQTGAHTNWHGGLTPTRSDADRVSSGAGSDMIFTGLGRDIIAAGAGNDESIIATEFVAANDHHTNTRGQFDRKRSGIKVNNRYIRWGFIHSKCKKRQCTLNVACGADLQYGVALLK